MKSCYYCNVLVKDNRQNCPYCYSSFLMNKENNIKESKEVKKSNLYYYLVYFSFIPIVFIFPFLILGFSMPIVYFIRKKYRKKHFPKLYSMIYNS